MYQSYRIAKTFLSKLYTVVACEGHVLFMPFFLPLPYWLLTVAACVLLLFFVLKSQLLSLIGMNKVCVLTG